MTTEAPTTPNTKTYAMLDVELRLQVPVPVEQIVERYGKPEEISQAKLWDALNENPDALFDALFLFLDGGGQPWSVEFDSYEDREPQMQPAARKPGEGFYYSEEIPSLIDGAVTITDGGMEFLNVSPINTWSNERIEGGYAAARKIWGLPWMGLAQRLILMQFLSELQWGMLSRPALHRFKPGDFEGDVVTGYKYPPLLDEETQEPVLDETGQPQFDYSAEGEPVIEHVKFDPTLCHHCGKPEEGHLVPAQPAAAQ